MPEGLNGVSSMATRQILAELVDLYRARTGHGVDMLSIGGVDAARRVRQGEQFDLVILADDAMTKLEAEGHVKAGSLRPFTVSAIAVAAPSGSVWPEPFDEEAVRAAIIEARSIGYSTGPSGDHLMHLLDKWNLARQVADKLVQARPGVPVGALIKSGEAALGFQQKSELQGVAGVDIIAELPDAIQKKTVFTCGLPPGGLNEAEALSFIAFITSPDAHACIQRNGMSPP